MYGVPAPYQNLDPLDELIATILSQSTTNVNSQRAFESLKKRFPAWEQVRRARPATIAEAIKSGGLANVKSVVIKNILQEIKARCGTLDLSFLRSLGAAEALKFLTSLKGVGPKTARCVLLFACDLPVFPMDTHIFRIARRLEIIPQKCSDEQAHQLLAPLIPPHKHLSLHINLIHHGRRICHPRNPQCNRCCLLDYCPVGQQQEM
ncbi:MAG: endonuclease III [Acidobacteria bacterium]|nr:endonuclease III [Acidobacteriota bacterium]